jgi:hypothetical protein
MTDKRFIVQIGCGTDQHGHNNDCTNAAIKAIKNAISNNCLAGLSEICKLKDPKDILIRELGDISNLMLICNAAVTVSIS